MLHLGELPGVHRRRPEIADLAGLDDVVQPASAGDRPHRPLPDAPRRPGHAVGGDLAGDGAARRAGKVLYVGSSNFAGWHIADAQAPPASRLPGPGVRAERLQPLRARTIELEVHPRLSALRRRDSSHRARSAAACSAACCRRRVRAAVPERIRMRSGSSSCDRSWRPARSCVASSVRARGRRARLAAHQSGGRGPNRRPRGPLTSCRGRSGGPRSR